MKNNYWLILGLLLATSVVAQQATNTSPSAPLATPAAAPASTSVSAPAKTNAPPSAPNKKKSAKKKSEKKSVAKKKDAAAELKTVPLVAGPALVIASNVNVRGQARLKSEIVGRLNRDQAVVVIEEVTLKNSGPDEPSAWAKIHLPENVRVWVNTPFIDATNKTVIPKKLKLRAGPGENYSILGMLKRGETIKEASAKGDWMEIEAPPDAYAFVAAQYLKQEPGGALPPAEPTVPVVEAPPVAAAPTDAPLLTATNEPPTLTNAEPTAAEEPPPKRIVQREGIVRGTVSIQAPTTFALISPENGRTINYLHTTSSDLDLKRYKGLRIIVTGEEGLDERWRNTPVITIQRIQVVE